MLYFIFSENLFNKLFPEAPRIPNQDSLGTQAAVLGAALPFGFAAVNCLRGDCDLSISPNIGANIDPNTGRIVPALSGNVQVGNDNVVNPTFNFGAQLDQDSDGPLPVAPIIGSGINIGDSGSGGPTANVGTNVALSNGEPRPHFSGSFGLAAFNLGNALSGLGR